MSFRFAAFVALLALCAPGVFAQEAAEEGPVPSEAPAQIPADAETERFDSPRAAFGFFLERMLEDRADLVVESGLLELVQGSGAERLRIGMDLADRLYQTLSRTEYVVVADLPGPEYAAQRWTYVAYPPGDSFARIAVALETTDEHGWRITADTVRRIPTMWEAVRELPTIDAYRESLPLMPRLRLELRERMPEVLLEAHFLIESWQWLGLLVLTVLCVVLDRLARFVLAVILKRAAGRSRLEEEEVRKFERPVGLVVGALAFKWILPVLGIEAGLRTMLDLAAGTVATVAVVWAAYRLVDVVCSYFADRARRTDNKFDDMLVPLLRRTLKIFVTIIGLVYLSSLMSEDLWGVVAGLSIGSLAVGFAARDSIENLFGTFTVLLDKPFQLGDWVQTGDMEGTVEEVGFRSTRIRTFYDSVISVPNRHFISSPVDNLGIRRYRRIKTTLSLTYDTPPEKVEAFCEGVREILREHPFTRKDYYHVYLNAFSAASLEVLLYCFVACPDWGTELREKQRLFLDILRLAERLKVAFAFPTQTIHVAKPEDLEHPDRPGTDVEGTRRGRAAGEEVARGSLQPFAGGKPSPVAFDEEYFEEQVRGE